MADTKVDTRTDAQKISENRTQKGKVSFTIFKPKTIQFDLYKDKPYVVGLLIGRATGRFERTDDRTGEKYLGIKGAFKAIIGNDARDKAGTPDEVSVASGIAYLPDAWLHPILDALEGAAKDGAVAPTVDFVYEICLGRRGEQDYEWIVRDLRPATSVDPLAGLLQSAPAVQAIENKAGAKG